jgi:carbohydrate-selective porin OprB
MGFALRARRACPRCFRGAILALAVLLAAGSAVADDEVPAQEAGLTYQAVYKADLLQGLTQRIDRHDQFLGNLDLKLGWRGKPIQAGTTRALIQLLYNHGDKPNERYGTAQGVSNIETPVNTGKVYQAWLEQGLFGE